MRSIILASQSPRRKQLLEWAEIPFEVWPANTDETHPAGMAVEEIPVHIARGKALAIAAKKGEQAASIPILAADTIVVLDNVIMNKPANRQEAINMLSALSGRQHRVITGIVILYRGKETAFYDVTFVEFHPLRSGQIEFYVDKYQPYDKAGAYAIQEWIGVTGIKSITGDFYNVMGLPVSRIIQALEKITH